MMKKFLCFLFGFHLLSGSVSADQDLKDYVLGNTLLTLYHEFGHAIVFDLELPMLGREEDAADSFSLVTVLQKLGDIDAYGEEQASDLDAYLWATADTWLAYADEENAEDDYAFASAHALDLQRFYRHACLVYGANPEFHQDSVDHFEIPADLLEDCEDQFTEAYQSWDEVISNNLEDAEGESAEIDIAIESGSNAQQEEYASWLEDWFWLGDFEETMETLVPLPTTLEVVFESCGEANAFYDPNESRITMCYEQMVTYEQFYKSQD